MDDIDKLTLELLMNQTQKRKYLSKVDPIKSKEYEEHLENKQQYKDAILGLTENLLDDPTLQINTEINEIFETYVKTLIKYFQIKEIEDRPDFNEEDENTLFGERAFSNTNMYRVKSKPVPHIDPSLLENTCIEETEYRPLPTTHSFWGKSIQKRNSVPE
jgi:hypothetical protein